MTYFTSLNISKLELTYIFLPSAFHNMYWVKNLSDFDGPAFFEPSNNVMNFLCKVGLICSTKLGKNWLYSCDTKTKSQIQISRQK